MIITGNKTNYGMDIGILMLDTIFPRLVGDIGNAKTFPFPVRYKTVHRAFPSKVVLENGGNFLKEFISAAQELENEGVRAITTSCGFLAIYQQELAAAVSIPVFTSSLLQIPMIQRMISPQRKIVIVTAHGEKLSQQHLRGAGVQADESHYVIVGLEGKKEFYDTFVKQKADVDPEKLAEELAEAATHIKNNWGDAGAIVLECTNLPPFRTIFQQITGLPVFDIVTLVHYAYAGLNQVVNTKTDNIARI